MATVEQPMSRRAQARSSVASTGAAKPQRQRATEVLTAGKAALTRPKRQFTAGPPAGPQPKIAVDSMPGGGGLRPMLGPPTMGGMPSSGGPGGDPEANAPKSEYAIGPPEGAFPGVSVSPRMPGAGIGPGVAPVSPTGEAEIGPASLGAGMLGGGRPMGGIPPELMARLQQLGIGPGFAGAFPQLSAPPSGPGMRYETGSPSGPPNRPDRRFMYA